VGVEEERQQLRLRDNAAVTPADDVERDVPEALTPVPVRTLPCRGEGVEIVLVGGAVVGFADRPGQR
jgi:hypothetical protein